MNGIWPCKSTRCAGEVPKKAIIAVTASMLTAVYHMLKDHVPYHDLGGEYFYRRGKSVMAKRLINKLNTLGFHVEV